MSQSNSKPRSSPLLEPSGLFRAAWASLWIVILVQGLNAFNDNFIKTLMISYVKEGEDSFWKENVDVILMVLFNLPYILLAPMAGWLSDRYSKQRVIVWMMIFQAVVLLQIALAFQHDLFLLGLIGFLLITIQSVIFSPAKLGIAKELVGSDNLGSANGLMQLWMMVGVLAGMGVVGPWFDARMQALNGDAAQAAALPVWILFGVSLFALFAALRVKQTPPAGAPPLHKEILWEHVTHLKQIIRQPVLREYVFGVSIYWFIANSVALLIYTVATFLYPDGAEVKGSGFATALSFMSASLGIGVLLGSVFVSILSRGRIELGLVPFGSLGILATLIALAITSPHEVWLYRLLLVLLGTFAACYLIPLMAKVQEVAAESERGRVISVVNLLDCLAGLASVAVIFLLRKLNLPIWAQFAILGGFVLVLNAFVLKKLLADLIRMVFLWVFRGLYRVQVIGADKIPDKGGFLLVPNHVSFIDAFVLSFACPRPIRFVMYENYYRNRWIQWFLKLFHAVPISNTKAKDALKTVATAIREGGLVCIFPEGKLTTDGKVDEFRKGFELSLRSSGRACIPAYMDGLWGSIFTYYGGKVFWKLPMRFPLQITVAFGEPVPAEEGTAERMKEEVLMLKQEIEGKGLSPKPFPPTPLIYREGQEPLPNPELDKMP